MKQRLYLPRELAGLTRSEWEKILSEARYGSIDAEIVRVYIIEGGLQIDAASEVDRTRVTVYRRMRNNIIPRAREVAEKLHMI